jgi:predicted alpha/beta superfamily hydrolase
MILWKSEMYDDGAGTELQGNVVGNIRRLERVESPQLGNRRDVLVYLPPSYGSSGRHYPVLYMQDGQNLFDATTSFAGEWHVDETMERVSREGLEAIVVAIPNSGKHRADEYSPFEDERIGGGKGESYLSFLVDTLKPRIDAEFRTRREPVATGIMGSSMGGLISLYALLRRPDTFGFAGTMSPALWFARGAIFRVANEIPHWDGRLYLDTGTLEGRGHVRQVREMVRLLRRRAVHPRRQIRYVEERGAHHNEAAWARRFEPALRWMLPKKTETHW